jgi:hypothetical protein
VSAGLAGLSFALGLAPTIAPGKVATAIGARPTPGTTRLLRWIGIREFAAGALLAVGRTPALAWVRVAGDAMDLPLAVRSALRASSGRSRAWATVGILAAISAVDVAAAVAGPKPAGPSPVEFSSSPARSPETYSATQPGSAHVAGASNTGD